MYRSKKIILDFDGTIFRIFANYNLKNLVDKINVLLMEYPIGFTNNNDAFDAFSLVAKSNLLNDTKNTLLSKIDDWVIEAEIDALKSGILVDGFFEFVAEVKKRHIDIAIVSNNSANCIKEFLNKSNIDFPIPVIGRVGIYPERMKPSVYMLEEISIALKSSKEDIIFVGDNYRDYECAICFGCQFIGMTPTSKKKERLFKNAPGIISVNNFFELSELLFRD